MARTLTALRVEAQVDRSLGSQARPPRVSEYFGGWAPIHDGREEYHLGRVFGLFEKCLEVGCNTQAMPCGFEGCADEISEDSRGGNEANLHGRAS
jgi:hypothetical protein